MSTSTKRPRTASTLPTMTIVHIDTTTPHHDTRRLSTITMMDQRGEQVKITAILNVLQPEANAHNHIDVDECITETIETHENEVATKDLPVPSAESDLQWKISPRHNSLSRLLQKTPSQ